MDPQHPGDERLPDDRARAIWKRAARLQADAAERLEERSRTLARRSADALPDGYRVADIEAAAVEAGIAPEFVRLALAEAAGQARRGRQLSRRMDRAATRLLATERRSLEASRIILAPPGDVFEAMQRLLPQHPYRLELRDSIGQDPREGGVLIFGTPSHIGTSNEFALDMAYADLKELHFVLRPLRDGDREIACEVTVTSDLEHGRRLNLWVGGGVVSAGATGGGAALGAIAVAGGVATAVAALPVAAGVLVGGGLFAAAYRALYRWGIERGVKALDGLLQALDVNARTRGAFASPPPTQRNLTA
jgi:hypothetical protein